MRYAITGDIHGNLAAFQAVLDDVERQGGAGKLWCLGDVVGYGPDPHECIELLRRNNHLCVAGNHDLAAIGRIRTDDFNPDAAAALRWTAQQLSLDDIEYLGSLPLTIEENDFTLSHGSPREPIREYLITTSAAVENFNYFHSRYCLVGHSHLPLVFSPEKDVESRHFLPGQGILLGETRLIINPGSVGQPRDGNPEASYALFDTGTGLLELRRVVYNIESTQERMRKEEFPARLISRLSYGL